MACDARVKAPNPCSRCKSNDLDCCFAKNFKRVSTRRITRDIVNELHIVRASQNPDEQSPPPSNRPSTTPSGARSTFVLSADVEVGHSPNFVLGSVSIPPRVAVELFRHFERYYLPRVAFIAPIQSLARFVADSPLLFWTMVLIASQHHDKYSHLYQDLFFPHQELLAPLSNTAIRSLENVHAILLLCVWPTPKRRILHDPSWAFIGIAVNSCMALNCHKPLAQRQTVPNGTDAYRNVDVRTRCLTWLACFSVGTQTAIFLGFAPPMSSFHQLKYVRKAIDQLTCWLSCESQAGLAICEIMCNYAVSLEDLEDPAAHLSLTNMFDSRLDNIKQTYFAHWTPELGIHLHIAKLNLYALSALLPLQENSLANAQNVINRQTLFLRGLESATTLINYMKNIAFQPDTEDKSPTGRLPFLPSHFFSGLFFSAVFLFRIFICLKPLSPTHGERAFQGMIDAQSTFRVLPHHRSLARAARLIGKLIEKAQTAGAAGDHWPLAELTVTNRLGASILWDTFARMQGEANLGRRNPTGEAISAPKMRLIGPDPLPSAPEMTVRLPNFAGEPLVRTTTAEERELSSWAPWGVDLNNFGFDFDQQMF
ncbi:uncharacterized protein Z519_01380 [Cladophialophora bantiana CBS 173.52]|uniref:Transcription factor domain-containing protein n=1 Tax=Cladophialophora bantiana (strain ATCC 10958 / CBS 173.52 / CDC B-1940 / NIH 8579) TaxID=1442370 RepID=A0A0D2F6I3_CLAB1|nr:uncharacterized protein Z519_01380 [Cladophialophora bantiana CBS 173.52]KIW97796.1 hypothetical protein Z519_01380 [Cladophialophora bantiana CBS 173.52]